MTVSPWRAAPGPARRDRVARPLALLAGAVAAALALTACGGSGGTARPPAQAAAGGMADMQDMQAVPPSLRALPTTMFGSVVADNSGRTLYRFDRDRPRPSATTCVDQCERTWPPAVWTPELRITGIDRERVGRVRRPDGSWQVTLGGWPLYRYAGDTAPTQTTGHGKGGVWFASAPNGGKARLVQPAPPGTRAEDARVSPPNGGAPSSPPQGGEMPGMQDMPGMN
ncbi:COG4315 family predicted lipoprotein [Actinomadura kijaniata]|uniref:COG4315 family predicted lipoprotein n=1 Tax=Actinomadura kijaniata TaxID=46161 RepID=UPI003F1E0083